MRPFDTSGLINRKRALTTVKELDAFPKVPDNYKETTAAGGGISIVVFVLITILIISEVQYYSTTDLKFGCEVDTDFNSKLQINVDITVAMKCAWIGADILDMTGQATAAGLADDMRLQHEDVYYELAHNQRRYFNMMQHLNEYLRNEYHAVQTFLWKTGLGSMPRTMPPRDDKREGPTDGCRVHGTLIVNKVAGNFHITAGKAIYGGSRHMHFSANVLPNDYNFSHRIDQFSFGKATPGVINPMDGDEHVTSSNRHMFQYFVQVVATKVSTYDAQLDTFQYAVTEHNRTINHATGSHGIPGIFVKYDLSSLKISVREEHKSYIQFLVRLCGIIGGIFATSGMIHSLMSFLFDLVRCRLGSKRETREVVGEMIPVRNLSMGELPATDPSQVSLIPQDTGAS